MDFPDPDVIRVDDTYYMVSTTMHFMPGCEILRSYDLRNWEHCTYVYETLDGTPAQKLEGDANVYGKGMWAASFRYHKGKFYICFVANDTQKTYLYTAEDIQGPWKKQNIEGFYHDCSLLFDDDDRVYIAYGNRQIYITELNEDLTAPKEGGLHRLAVVDTTGACLGYEGTHLYKINGKYYMFFIHSLADRWFRVESCFMADSIDGEFTGGDVFVDDRAYCGSGVAQGAIVDTPEGNWYAILFQDSGAVGRMPVLLPVTWEGDKPVFGVDGKVPEKFEIKSTRPGYQYKPLVGSDNFKGELRDSWQFNHEPDLKLVEHDKEKGTWKVTTDKVVKDLTQAKNTLTQRMSFPGCAASVQVDGSNLKEGDFAGLCALQGKYGFIGLTRKEGKLYLTVHGKDMEREPLMIPMEKESIQIKLAADFDQMKDTLSFAYRDGWRWTPLTITLKVCFRLDHFTGCRFGLCVYSEKEAGGSAVFSNFEYFER
ncbi:MAG: glycoside hydrolase 43 family protein [Acetatifactor sp.]|nr:glycoside hydrolase 43 family protein [Acetatifactor sp.]